MRMCHAIAKVPVALRSKNTPFNDGEQQQELARKIVQVHNKLNDILKVVSLCGVVFRALPFIVVGPSRYKQHQIQLDPYHQVQPVLVPIGQLCMTILGHIRPSSRTHHPYNAFWWRTLLRGKPTRTFGVCQSESPGLRRRRRVILELKQRPHFMNE
jgi:hypothetical protein